MEPEESLPHSIPSYPNSWRSIFILFSHLRSGLQSGLLPSGFPTKTLYAPLPIHATWTAHFILLDLIARKISEEYRSFSPLPCYIVPLGPNILLSTLFSKTLSPSSALSISDQVSHPYKTKLNSTETIKLMNIRIWHSLIASYLITYLLTYLLTPWSRVLLEKLSGYQLVNKFPAFYGNWRFITAFTSAHHLSISWASSIQSMPPHTTSWRSILILYSHLGLGLPSGFFPSGFPTKTLYTPLLSPISATCTAHLFLLDLNTRTILGEEYRSLSSSLSSFLHPLLPHPF